MAFPIGYSIICLAERTNGPLFLSDRELQFLCRFVYKLRSPQPEQIKVKRSQLR